VDRPAPNAEGNVADRPEIAEALAEAFRDENIVHSHSRRPAQRTRFPPMKAKANQAARAPLVKQKRGDGMGLGVGLLNEISFKDGRVQAEQSGRLPGAANQRRAGVRRMLPASFRPDGSALA
jgi:hypothetical protein